MVSNPISEAATATHEDSDDALVVFVTPGPSPLRALPALREDGDTSAVPSDLSKPDWEVLCDKITAPLTRDKGPWGLGFFSSVKCTQAPSASAWQMLLTWNEESIDLSINYRGRSAVQMRIEKPSEVFAALDQPVFRFLLGVRVLESLPAMGVVRRSGDLKNQFLGSSRFEDSAMPTDVQVDPPEALMIYEATKDGEISVWKISTHGEAIRSEHQPHVWTLNWTSGPPTGKYANAKLLWVQNKAGRGAREPELKRKMDEFLAMMAQSQARPAQYRFGLLFARSITRTPEELKSINRIHAKFRLDSERIGALDFEGKLIPNTTGRASLYYSQSELHLFRPFSYGLKLLHGAVYVAPGFGLLNFKLQTQKDLSDGSQITTGFEIANEPMLGLKIGYAGDISSVSFDLFAVAESGVSSLFGSGSQSMSQYTLGLQTNWAFYKLKSGNSISLLNIVDFIQTRAAQESDSLTEINKIKTGVSYFGLGLGYSL